MSRRMFILQAGPDPGRTFVVEDGRLTVGRADGAAIQIPHHTVSKAHALVTASDDLVTVTDHGSTNGTRVNGRPAVGQPLANGDIVEFGAVALQYQLEQPAIGGDISAARDQTTNQEYYRLGSVAGAAQAGSGTQYNVGGDMHQTDLRGDRHYGDRFGGGNVAGGDQHIGHRFGDINIEQDSDFDELFQGSGLGLVVMWVGLVATLVGFGLFAFTIFSFFGDIQSGFAGNDPFADSGRHPFDTELGGIATLPFGFGLFIVGAIMTSIGRGMSRSRRRRTQGPGAVRPIRKADRR